MALVVTGLSPDGDLTALTAALRGVGLDSDDIAVAGPRDALDGNVASLAGFGGAGADVGVGTNTGSGTGVPGINSTHRLRTYFRTESIDERLGDFDIPASEADNYLEALERGRTLVAFRATAENVDAVESAFRATGLRNVRRF